MATRNRVPAVLAKHWPLWAGIAFALGNFAWLLASQLAATGGRLVYPSDDAYLRLAVARNLATHATWGLDPGQFASVTGSIAWPVFIAILALVLGAQSWIPLVVNIGLSLFLIVLCYRTVSEFTGLSWFKALSLVLLVWALPLGPLAAGGLEHVLQLVFCLFFAKRLMRHWTHPRRGDGLVLALLGALLSVTRYEGLLLVLAACLLLVARREFRLSLGLGLISVAPIALYALVSIRHGWMPIPNTVYFRRAPLAPATWGERFAVLTRFFDILDQAPDLRAIVLIPTLALLWRSLRGRVRALADREFVGVILFLLTALFHVTLIGNPNDRYDAYLILLGWWAALPLLAAVAEETQLRWESKAVLPWTITVVLGLLLFFPLLNRGITDNLTTPVAARNVYEQEFQAARLAAACSAGHPVASDKVGLIAYQGSHVLDLSGFGTMSVARARRSGTISAALLQGLAQEEGVQLAIVNDPGLRSAIPTAWKGLGVWTIHDCLACAETGIGGISSDYLYLYATSPAAVDSLRPCLAGISATLPPSVVQSSPK